MPISLVATQLGTIGIVWNDIGLTRLALPTVSCTPRSGNATDATDATADDTELSTYLARFTSDAPEPPTGLGLVAATRIVALFEGARDDLTDLPLDLRDVPPFHREVYEATRRIPPGETRTYGEIAKVVGSPGASRAVGGALGKNPFPIVVPCHRVLAAGGKSGGFTAPGGVDTKWRMLALEGAKACGSLSFPF
jgi:methylated-DNA-[protein]-cysteine S-methyltransferase